MLIKKCNIEGTGIKDILIRNGRIAKIADSIDDIQDEKVINANGFILIPGVIDPHVHARDLNLSHKEDFYTVSCAAAAGGVTSFLDMPNSNPPTITVKDLMLKRNAAKKSIVNYGFYFGASVGNVKEMAKADNIAAVKLYMGSTTGDLLVEDEGYMDSILEYVPIVCVHAEDETVIRKYTEEWLKKNMPEVHSMIRPNSAAERAVRKIVDMHQHKLSRLYICHASTREEMKIIEDAKKKKNNIFVEVCPHHLFMTKDDLKTKGNFAKMNPPLRSEEDVYYLWDAIKRGVVDVIATDHAPHTITEKLKEYKDAPSGVPGIENSLALMLNAVNKDILELRQVINMMCKNPAKIFNIKNKGHIEEGYDADLVLIDMQKEKVIKNEEQLTKCKWSPYDKMKLKGWPVMTIINGNIVYDNGKINDEKRGVELKYGR